MFHQLLTPVGDNLFLSFLVAALPILTVLVLLGLLRRPGWQAALAGLIVGLIVAVTAWQLPVGLALDAAVNGMVFALWPVMWIVLNALLLYNIAVVSGRFDAFRDWIIAYLPNDRRVVLVVVGFCFGALLEGVSGFGTPVAITSALLILVGYPPIEALAFVLIFNTAPVAFGALGAPVTVLGAVTGLPAATLGAMIGRQLPVMALILPFYVMALYGGRRSVAALWPMLLVAGGSFAVSQFIASNFIDYALTDVLASLGSLAVTLLFLRVWKPAPDPAFMITAPLASQRTGAKVAAWQGWVPWLLVSAVVILWTSFKVAGVGQTAINWPGLHNAIAITLYNDKPYAAIWSFQPLATGTAILLSAILTARLSHELCRARLYAGQGSRVGGAGFRAAIALPWMDRGVPVRQRYLRQRVVWKFASGRRPTVGAKPGAVRGDQLLGRRDGQDDLTPEYRDRRRGDGFEGPRGRRVRPHLLAQRHPHLDPRVARRAGAICDPRNYSRRLTLIGSAWRTGQFVGTDPSELVGCSVVIGMTCRKDVSSSI